ncbi:MAG: hypothetical protein KL785_05345 [Brevundimonas sp.]|nr:hypothetical protein [Brevundimonas sp.]MBX9460595.1 hypothetical protein [Brevundimonas sp.]
MLTPALIVLALLALGAGIVIWATRRKPERPPVGPRETDTGWNDPVTPGQFPTPRETFTHDDPHSAASQEPRP